MKSDLQKVLISNASGIKMVWFQIPTVVWISDPHCSVLTLRTKNCLKKGSQKLFLITDIYFLVNRMYHWRYNTKNSMKWNALVLCISTIFRVLGSPESWSKYTTAQLTWTSITDIMSVSRHDLETLDFFDLKMKIFFSSNLNMGSFLDRVPYLYY